MRGSAYIYLDSYFYYSPPTRVAKIRPLLEKVTRGSHPRILFSNDIIKASYIKDLLRNALSGSGSAAHALRLAWDKCRRGKHFNPARVPKGISDEALFFAEFIAFITGTGRDTDSVIQSLSEGNCSRDEDVRIGRERCRALGRLVSGNASPLGYYLSGRGRHRLADVFREYALCRLRALLRIDAVVRLPGAALVRRGSLISFLRREASRCLSACDLGKHGDDVAKAAAIYEWLRTRAYVPSVLVATTYSAGAVGSPDEECFSCIVNSVDVFVDLRGL